MKTEPHCAYNIQSGFNVFSHFFMITVPRVGYRVNVEERE